MQPRSPRLELRSCENLRSHKTVHMERDPTNSIDFEKTRYVTSTLHFVGVFEFSFSLDYFNEHLT